MKHCYCSPPVALLAYFALLYLGSSVLYLVLTACLRVGRPFADSLTPEQRHIKRKSAEVRGVVFVVSLAVLLATLAYTRPLSSMQRKT